MTSDANPVPNPANIPLPINGTTDEKGIPVAGTWNSTKIIPTSSLNRLRMADSLSGSQAMKAPSGCTR